MRFEMVAIEPEEFEAMKARLPKATAEGLFDAYRISQNTWYKLRDGVPVKRKTLEQLRVRYREIAGG
ncbi:hypothetical protein GON01_16360 [Sphingomonas sp. MAH-20]|jgi:hypothetical protein|uniref:Transcriptional regulator n=1 Tax=Sphingomonas horti TaxID=2682842 RepID=A0A6I4J589_9SPHN|nr:MULTISPECIES: hypothetical protein [Sphingomonas]MBA2921265.1 hypothetical protein [Sphingomonas sp. CGMCC 1.13658]MVO79506.1 hypothetical protein [Sphingomonas horti]